MPFLIFLQNGCTKTETGLQKGHKQDRTGGNIQHNMQKVWWQRFVKKGHIL